MAKLTYNSRNKVKENDKNLRNKYSEYVDTMIIVAFVLMFVFCTIIQIVENKKNTEQLCVTMMNQIKEIISDNEEGIKAIEDTLKDEYIIRARMAAESLETTKKDYSDKDTFSQSKLGDLAKKLQVDEVHIFNKEGVIVNGSVEEYIGYSLNSGKQMAYFKPMLTGEKNSMCQDVTPNTAEGKPMMYAMVWNSSKTALIQIGVTPERLLTIIDNRSVRNQVNRMPVTEGMNIYVSDANTGKIIGSTERKLIGHEIKEEDKVEDKLTEGMQYQRRAVIQDKSCYITFERMKDYNIAVACTVSAANKNLPFTMVELFVILLVAYLLIRHINNKYIRILQKQGDALAEANAAKSVFLSRMSHDIRTPLNGIIGLLEISERKTNDEALLIENRKKAKIAAEHLLSLLNDVLEVTKFEDDKVNLEHEPFLMTALLKDVITMGSLKSDKLAINVVDNIDYSSIEGLCVFGSTLHVRQVLLNILDNSIKYNKPQGSVFLNATVKEMDENTVTCVFECRDTGIGMKEEFLTHIFEPFSQEHSDARSNFKGTGLGMNIVKSLVDKMDGTIDIESREGEGSTFTVTLTFDRVTDKETVEALQKKEQKENVANIEGINILLVEDNELNREIASMLLSDHGCNVDEACDGEEALIKFRESEEGYYDLILMDLMMPVMDGIESTKEIRKLDRKDSKTVTIIALTANTYDEDIARTQEAGMNAHMGKPFKIEKLIELINEYVKIDKK